jgi:DUF4097 and DUF4098 domain-containing protein YvlB
MPTFPTPDPIELVVELSVGDVRVTASDRTDAVVEIRATNPGDRSDERAAGEVTVEYADGRLLIKSLKKWRQYTPFGPSGSVDILIDVPTGSSLRADTMMGSFTGDGEFGPCHLRTGMGHIRLDHVGPLRLKTSHGNITVDRATGHSDVTSGSGDIRLGDVDGNVVVKNSNGDTHIGAVTGEVRVKCSNGDISIERAARSVVAKTASGDIRIGEVVRGAVVLRTAAGELDVGIHRGTAAWLDVSSQYGRVHNLLDVADGPGPSDDTVEVRARTSHGDIVIHRSNQPPVPVTLQKEEP